MESTPLRRYPGLVKIRAVPLLRRRTVELVVAEAGPIGDVIERADVISEGRVDEEGGHLTYYGSTSVLLLARSAGGEIPDGQIGAFTAVLRRDPHARLRVLRLAHREATARAGGTLGTIRAEIDVSPSARGVALLVEVMARVARGDVLSTRGLEDAGAARGTGPDVAQANADR